MLFDLRSRGRRRTVQAVYLFLAIILGGGLVLFGVGAGNGFGGILDAFTGNGSGSSQGSAVSQQEKTALQQTKQQPNNAQAWGNLVQARWSSAGQGSNFNSSTGQYTASGKRELTGATQAYERYLQLVKAPDAALTVLAARAYQYLGNYASSTAAWSDIADASPNQATAFECLAANAYAAGQTRKGDLATAKALTLVPSVQRTLLKSRIQGAKTNPALAQSC